MNAERIAEIERHLADGWIAPEVTELINEVKQLRANCDQQEQRNEKLTRALKDARTNLASPHIRRSIDTVLNENVTQAKPPEPKPAETDDQEPRLELLQLRLRIVRLNGAIVKALGRIQNAQSASSTPLNLLGAVGILEAVLADTGETNSEPVIRFDPLKVVADNERQEAVIMRLRKVLVHMVELVRPRNTGFNYTSDFLRDIKDGPIPKEARAALDDTAEEPSQ